MRKYTNHLRFLSLFVLSALLLSSCGSASAHTTIASVTESEAPETLPEAEFSEEGISEKENYEKENSEEVPITEPSEADSSSAPAKRNLSDKTFSLLGDSISTFTGTQPSDYNIFYPESGEIHVLEDTWWMQMADMTGMTLCRNAASSNTTVRGDSTDRSGNCPGCSTRRVEDLGRTYGLTPDLILILIGTNDFLRSVEPGTYTGPTPRQEGDTTTFAESYELMLQKVLALYPDSEVWCLTLLTPGVFDDPEGLRVNECGADITVYNDLITSIGSSYQCHICDMNACGITWENLADYTGDGVHPNPKGASLMAAYASNALMSAAD